MKNKKILLPLTLLATLFALSLAGCANKKPLKVNARPIAVSQVAPISREIQRTLPGQVMDPEAEVFAQVPKRIVYLPGENQLTGRKSPEQIAAYSLVKVGALPEVQSGQPTSVILTDPSQNPQKGETDIINLSINDIEEGTARILNIRKSEDIDLARGRLRQGETLKYFDQTGWVGWIPKKQNTPQEEPPPMLNTPPNNAMPLPELKEKKKKPEEDKIEIEIKEKVEEDSENTSPPEEEPSLPPRLSPIPKS